MFAKTLSTICPRSLDSKAVGDPRNPKLVAQWQRGLETMSGQAQWKLHFTLAQSLSSDFATVNRCEQP